MAESLLSALEQKDIKTRLDVLPRLETAVADGQLDPADVGRAVGILALAAKDNNFRVCQGALSVLRILVQQLGEEFRPHIPGVLPALIATLGDMKQPVRSTSAEVVSTLMGAVGAAETYQVLMPHFGKLNSRSKQQVAMLFTDSLVAYELRSLPVAKMVPVILGFLNDVKPDAREAAIDCLVELYRHMGGQLRSDLNQRQLRPAHMKLLNERFDQVEALTEVPGGSTDLAGGVELNGRSNDALGASLDPPSPRARPSTMRRPVGTGTGSRGRASSGGVGDALGSSSETPLSGVAGSAGGSAAAVKVYSERDLARECDTIATTLKQQAHDMWSSRLKAIEKLTALVAGGATEFDSFGAIFKKMLLQPMAAQINDLRSSIVKAACLVLVSISSQLGDAFEQFAEHFVPLLWPKTIVTIQVIAESCNECICATIKNTQAPRLLPKIVELGVSDKNALLRAHGLHYLALILQDWSTPAIERSLDVAEDAIRRGMSDANGEARAAARRSFWAYKPRWPERANRVMATLDGSTQRLLLEEEFGPSAPTHSTYTRKKRSTPRSPGGSASGAPRSPTSASSGSGGGDAAWATSRAQLERDPPNSPPVGRRMTSGGRLQTIEAPGKDESRAQRTMNAPQGRKAPGRVPSERGQRSGANRVPLNSATESSDAPAPSMRSKPERVPRHSTGGTSVSTRVPTAAIEGVARVGRSQRAERRPRSAGSDSGTSETRNSTRNDESAGQKPAIVGPAGFDPGFADALSRTDSATWNVRFGAFQELQRFCCAEQSTTVLRHIESLVKSLEEHVNDAHHRVTQVALDALSAYVEQYGAQLETFLDRLLPKVFLKISDTKEATRNSAISVLESARVSYQAEVLIPVLLKVLAQSNPKIRLGCIDFLQYLLEHCSAELRPYFRSGHHTKQCLLRVAPLVADKNAGLRKLSAKTLAHLHRLNQEEFLGSVVALPIDDQTSVRKAVAPHLPDLDQELITYTRQANGSVGSTGRKQQQPQLKDGGNGRVDRTEEAPNLFPADDLAGVSDAMNGIEQRRAAAEATARLAAAQVTVQSESGAAAQPTPSYPMQDPPPAAVRPSTAPATIRQVRQTSQATVQGSVAAATAEPSDARARAVEAVEMQRTQRMEAAVGRPAAAITASMSTAGAGASNGRSNENPAHSLATDWNAVVSPLMAALSTTSGVGDAASQRTALHQIQMLSRQHQEAGKLWQKYFGQIMLLVLESLSAADSSTRETGLATIMDMAKNLGGQPFAGHLEIVVAKLFGCAKDESRAVTQKAEEALECLLKLVDPPQRAVQVIVPIVIYEDSPVLQAAIRTLSKLVPNLPPALLLESLPSVLPGLFEAFRHTNADVRKAVVFALVDMYMVIGPRFEDHLGELNPSQLRLVRIYINRMTQARASREAAAQGLVAQPNSQGVS